MPKSENREYRSMTMEAVRAEDESTEERRVAGYASTFDDPYVLFENDDIIYTEQIDRSAFDECDMADVIMQYDHEGRVSELARIIGGVNITEAAVSHAEDMLRQNH